MVFVVLEVGDITLVFNLLHRGVDGLAVSVGTGNLHGLGEDVNCIVDANCSQVGDGAAGVCTIVLFKGSSNVVGATRAPVGDGVPAVGSGASVGNADVGAEGGGADERHHVAGQTSGLNLLADDSGRSLVGHSDNAVVVASHDLSDVGSVVGLVVREREDVLVGDLNTLLLESSDGLIGQGLQRALRGVHDSGVLAAEFVHNVVSQNSALCGVEGTILPGVGVVFLGHAGGRTHGHERDLSLKDGGKCCDAVGGVHAADDAHDLVVGEQFLGSQDGHFKVVNFVSNNQFQHLAVDAAGGVDLVDGELSAFLRLFTNQAVRAGDSGHEAELDGAFSGSGLLFGRFFGAGFCGSFRLGVGGSGRIGGRV